MQHAGELGHSGGVRAGGSATVRFARTLPETFLSRRLLITLALLALAGIARAAPGPTPIRHVFVIVLENQGFEASFAPGSPAAYLARQLPRDGVLLTEYYGTGHFSLDNYLAMISGQAATPETRDDCERFADFHATGTTPDGQAIGRGCVYPASVRTLADELEAVGLRWRGYFEDMGNDPARESPTCGHPPLDAPDPTQSAAAPSARIPAGDAYAVRHNPFVYFHSLIDSPTCARKVVGLAALRHDLERASTTPNFAFIAPNLCHDGHDAPCATGEPGGLVSADRFLRHWIPRIRASPAYRDGGLIVVTFDEGDAEERREPDGTRVSRYAGRHCCGQLPGPNLAPFPQRVRDGEVVIEFADYGGERIGAVLLSPFLPGGVVSRTPFNHYSLLRTLEDLFAVGGHLGYAGQAGQRGFFEAGSDVPLPRVRRP